MPLAKILLTIYGILLIAGGFMGLKAGSKVSLIMGSISGIATLLALYTTANPAIGYRFVAIISGILCVVFILRLLETHKFMPSGMLLLLSLAALIISLCQFFKK